MSSYRIHTVSLFPFVSSRSCFAHLYADSKSRHVARVTYFVSGMSSARLDLDFISESIRLNEGGSDQQRPSLVSRCDSKKNITVSPVLIIRISLGNCTAHTNLHTYIRVFVFQFSFQFLSFFFFCFPFFRLAFEKNRR